MNLGEKFRVETEAAKPNDPTVSGLSRRRRLALGALFIALLAFLLSANLRHRSPAEIPLPADLSKLDVRAAIKESEESDLLDELHRFHRWRPLRLGGSWESRN